MDALLGKVQDMIDDRLENQVQVNRIPSHFFDKSRIPPNTTRANQAADAHVSRLMSPIGNYKKNSKYYESSMASSPK